VSHHFPADTTERFPAAIEAQIDAIIARYPQKASALVPILQLVQESRGFVSVPDQERIARRLGLPPAWVAGVVSFYTMIYDRPMGRYHLQLCRTLSCALRGSERILDHIRDTLGIGEGETTPDGRFTLTTVECLGSCGTAPVVQINDDYHESLSVERFDQVLAGLKKD
jgi:NADH-quinone oxidoreductase E subunit